MGYSSKIDFFYFLFKIILNQLPRKMDSVRRNLRFDFESIIRPVPDQNAVNAYVHPTTEVPNPLLHARNRAALQRSREREALREESGIMNSCTKRLSFD